VSVSVKPAKEMGAPDVYAPFATRTVPLVRSRKRYDVGERNRRLKVLAVVAWCDATATCATVRRLPFSIVTIGSNMIV